MRRKIRLGAATLAWLAAFLLPLHAQIKTETFQGKLVAAGEVLVKFSPGSAPLRQLRMKEDLALIEPVGGTGILLLRSNRKSAAALTASLLKRKDVISVEPNYLLQMQTIPNDERFGEQWPLWNVGQTVLGVAGTPGADIGTFDAWDWTTGNRDHVVAVMDTGVDTNHPDLVNNLWSAPTDFTVKAGGRSVQCPAGTRGFNFVRRTCDPTDDNQHGTQLAGIIGAEGNNVIGISGVGWMASVMALKFLDNRGSGSTSSAVEAIDFAIQAKASGLANVRVIAAGWSDHVYSKALMDAIERAFKSDILFVAAAGNQGSNNDLNPSYPASYALPNVISVAASGNQDKLHSQSNYGPQTVHLAAPGAFLLTTIPNGAYDYATGSSLAAAHVAGAAALVLSMCPELGTGDLRTLLRDVQPVPALNELVSTRGRLNARFVLGDCDRPAFKLSASPQSQSVARGDSAIFDVHLEPTAGYVGEVPLFVDGLPSGATASFSPALASTPGDTVLTVAVGDNVALGAYLLTLRGTDEGFTTRTSPVWLEIRRKR